MRTTLLLAFACPLSLHAADSTKPLFWSASQTKDAVKKLPGKVNPERHLATERFTDSAFIAYRDGNGEAELHEKQADLIFFHEGEGVVLVGGKMASWSTVSFFTMPASVTHPSKSCPPDRWACFPDGACSLPYR